MSAAERIAAWHVSRHTPRPAAQRAKDTALLKTLKYARTLDEDDPEASVCQDPKAVRLLRRVIAVEGSPCLGFGCVEWVALALGLLLLFLARVGLLGVRDVVAMMGPAVTLELLEAAWKWAVVGYAGAVALHWVVTTRDG